MNTEKRHHWVRKHRGRASEHICEGCGKQASDWATLHEKDGSELDHYVALCQDCHRFYDSDGFRLIGKREEIARLRKAGVSKAAIRRLYGISRYALNRIFEETD